MLSRGAIQRGNQQQQPNRFTQAFKKMKEVCPLHIKEYATCIMATEAADSVSKGSCSKEFAKVRECFRQVRGYRWCAYCFSLVELCTTIGKTGHHKPYIFFLSVDWLTRLPTAYVKRSHLSISRRCRLPNFGNMALVATTPLLQSLFRLLLPKELWL